MKAACIQMNGRADVSENLGRAETLIRDAAAAGAGLIATPELTDQVLSGASGNLRHGFDRASHPGIARFAALAEDLGVVLLIGSMAVRLEDGFYANRSFLFTPGGKPQTTYDKIHLFDVDLPTGESHRESERYRGGDRAVIAQAGGATLGLSICYDLRFAALYRALAQAGAQILCVPAAFTVPTGQAHWEVLLRARAIETGSFVLAPAQSGEHEGGRRTWGHSMIVGPWGDVLAVQEEGEGMILADLDLAQVARARAAIPALRHDRDFKSPSM